MKIIEDNVVHVQKHDLAYLMHSSLDVPVFVSMKILKDGVIIIDDNNRYEFVSFFEPEEIEFFKNIDWMIDFNEVKDLSDEEMISLGQDIAMEKIIWLKNLIQCQKKNKKKI